MSGSVDELIVVVASGLGAVVWSTVAEETSGGVSLEMVVVGAAGVSSEVVVAASVVVVGAASVVVVGAGSVVVGGDGTKVSLCGAGAVYEGSVVGLVVAGADGSATGVGGVVEPGASVVGLMPTPLSLVTVVVPSGVIASGVPVVSVVTGAFAIAPASAATTGVAA